MLGCPLIKLEHNVLFMLFLVELENYLNVNIYVIEIYELVT